jgi:hypothetical protein
MWRRPDRARTVFGASIVDDGGSHCRFSVGDLVRRRRGTLGEAMAPGHVLAIASQGGHWFVEVKFDDHIERFIEWTYEKVT